MSNALAAVERKDFKKSVLTRLRKQGNIPAVVYGKHEKGQSIVVKNADLLKVIQENGRNGIISLELKSQSRDVILEDYQVNPINHDIIHADFLHVNANSEVHAKIYVELKGAAKGVEAGGILQQSLHELNITAKPKDIPEVIEVDITSLEIGHTIKIEEVRKNYRNISINHDDDEVVATIIAPKLQEEENDSTTGEVASEV